MLLDIHQWIDLSPDKILKKTNLCELFLVPAMEHQLFILLVTVLETDQ
jgi:hypothetical protein